MHLNNYHFYSSKNYLYSKPTKGLQGYGLGYRFHFNGKEKDSEGMGGGGSTYDYGFRIYNVQLGRFLSIDPLTKSYPGLTPYQYASNTPIWAMDIDGLEAWVATQKWNPDDRKAFGIFVQNEIKTILRKTSANEINKNTVFDCADLAVHLLIKYAEMKDLPVSFTLADGQIISNSSTSIKLPSADGKENEIALTNKNFEDIVRGYSNAKSLHNDMVNIDGEIPQAGDLSNSTAHVNVVRNPNEMLCQQDALSAENNGYVSTISGTTGDTNGLPGVPVTNDRLHVFSPDEGMQWMMWSVFKPSPKLPEIKVEPLKKDNVETGNNSMGGL
ncbi:MAG: RHS repeat domain-containing protein [Bacteroidia bacterium]